MLVPEIDFEVAADVKMTGAPRKAREHMAAHKPLLLTGVRARVVGPLDKMRPAELEALLTAAGATVVKSSDHHDGADSDADSDGGAGSAMTRRSGGRTGKRRGSGAGASAVERDGEVKAEGVITVASIAQAASLARAGELERAHPGGPVVDQTWVLDSISAWAVQGTELYVLSAMLRASAASKAAARPVKKAAKP